jgi:hypothetical protein
MFGILKTWLASSQADYSLSGSPRDSWLECSRAFAALERGYRMRNVQRWLDQAAESAGNLNERCSSDLPFLDAQHLVLWLLVLGTRQGHRHPERRCDRAGGDFHRLLPHPVRCPEHGWFCPTLNVVLRTRPEVYSLPLVIPYLEYYLEGPQVCPSKSRILVCMHSLRRTLLIKVCWFYVPTLCLPVTHRIL